MSLDTHFEKSLYTKETLELPNILKNCLPKIQSVYQPDNTQDLQKILSYSRRNKIPLIPRGAATSGMGGITPLRKSVMVDLTSLNKIIDLDKKNKTILIESGLRWWELKRFLKKHSLDLLTSPTSLFSTVGGWLATGGYGINSFRYGHVSNLVDSIEVLAPNSSFWVAHTDKEFKYYMGTEGQMGIMTKIKLNIQEALPNKPYLLLFNSSHKAVSFLSKLVRSRDVRPLHVSFLDRHSIHLKSLLLNGKISFPMMEGVLVVFEDNSSHASFINILEKEKGQLADDYLTSLLWNERFFPFSSRRFHASVLGCEAILPIQHLGSFFSRIKEFGDNFGLALHTEATLINQKEAVVFAIFPTDPKKMTHFFHLFITYSLAHIASKHGGRPYGIGIWNLPLLRNLFSEEEIKEYKQVKNELDPLNLMNPAKAFSNDRIIRHILKLAYSTSALFSNGFSINRMIQKKRSPHDDMITKDLNETEACANCGACTIVCPSYLINKTETVTAKGKLFLLKQLLNRKSLPKHVAEMAFLCCRCHLCDQVCQTRLKFDTVWDQLESILEREYGRPQEKIDEFLSEVEIHPDYSLLLETFDLPSNNQLRKISDV